MQKKGGTRMIYDTLEHRAQYRGLGERLARALDFLAETDFSAMPDGRCEIDGDDLFANIGSYETKPAHETPEAHVKYMDIQYVFEGRELIGVGPLEEMGEVVEARPEGDIWLYRAGLLDYLTLEKGRFIAVWPGDAHAPAIAAGDPAPARKCVVKVKL